MPALRKSLALAASDGAMVAQPQRFTARQRMASGGTPIGNPSDHMTLSERAAWAGFVAEMPGLLEAHRARLEVGCRLRAQLIDGARLGSAELSLLYRIGKELAESAADTNLDEDESDGL